PSWKDLQHYFEEITESFSGDRKLKEKILRYACYNAKNDFFDLKSMIKSLISGFDNSGHPYINISSDEEIHMKSYLHRIITLFENIYYVNDYLKQSGNEDIMRLLFKITDEITVSPPGANFLDPEDSSLKSSIKREFYNFLYKLEIFSLSRIEKNLVINTINIPIRRYVYNQQYKNTIPSSIFDLTEKQVRYRTYVNVYANKIIALYNAYANLMGFDIDRSTIKEKFKNKRDFYRNIGYDLSLISSHIDADQELGITRKRQYFTDEEITKKIDEINTQRRNYIMRLPRLISEIIKKIHSKRNIYVSKTISISSLSPDICAEMSAHNMHLLEFGNSEDQLMLLYDDGNLSKETSNALKSLGNYMIVVIKEKKGGTKYGHKLSEIIVDEKFEQSL
ncbi:hypothetical protein KAR04_06105, partial [Candidatus Calescamantes bacterium]|nr:hypothetical protein [Candidatus Calescamantes bacterium]